MKPVRNKFAGRCRRCNQIVPAGQGLAEKVGTVWDITHLGTCPPPPDTGMTPDQAMRSLGLIGEQSDYD